MKKLLLPSLILAVTLFSGSSVLATPIVSIVGPTTVAQGSMFAVDVNIANVTDLNAFQFDVGFNQNNLMAMSVAEGSFLPSGGSTVFIPGTIDNTDGVIAATADALVGAVGVSGSGTLAVFDFSAIGSGTTDLTVSNVILVDSNGNLINLVSNTPEPSTVILFALGALGLALKLRNT
jgi:adhesin HecA-like repeat protein